MAGSVQRRRNTPYRRPALTMFDPFGARLGWLAGEGSGRAAVGIGDSVFGGY